MKVGGHVTVHVQIEWPIEAPIWSLHGECLMPLAQGRIIRRRPVQFAIFRRLATIPIVCRNGYLNKTLIVRQNWIAASENTAGRPGRPSCRASQVIAPVQPDQQLGAPAQRAVVIGPVGCAVAGGCWLAHTFRLTAWIHDVNPPRSELCNSAAAMQHRQKAQCRTGASLRPTTKPNDLTLRISISFVSLLRFRNCQ
jgi:hypothetical protein